MVCNFSLSFAQLITFIILEISPPVKYFMGFLVDLQKQNIQKQSTLKIHKKLFENHQKVLKNVLTKGGFYDIIYERWQKRNKMAG